MISFRDGICLEKSRPTDWNYPSPVKVTQYLSGFFICQWGMEFQGNQVKFHLIALN